MTHYGPQPRLLLLLVLGLLALLSLLAMPFEQLLPEAVAIPYLRWLALIQPTVLLIAAIFVGHRLAPAVGLNTPLLDAASGARLNLKAALRALSAAAIGAAMVAAFLILYAIVLPQLIGPGGDTKLLTFRAPLVTRLLWGGIGEELLMRWGVMTLLAWIAWRLTGREATVSDRVMLAAILMAALLFALGHLPALVLLMPEPPAVLIVAVLSGNLVPGALFGWLFWRHGLEAAMVAHGGAHLLAWLLGA